jgi:hypothetical protein
VGAADALLCGKNHPRAAAATAITAIIKAASVAQRDSFDAGGAAEWVVAVGSGDGAAAGSAAPASVVGSAECAPAEGSVGDVSDIRRWYRPHLRGGGCLGVKK